MIHNRRQNQSKSAAELMPSKLRADITRTFWVTAAFMQGGFCLTNVFEFSEYIGALLDKYVIEDIIYHDFREAFDSVPQRKYDLQSKTKMV